MIDERFPKWEIDVEKGTIYSLRLKRYIGIIDKDGYIQTGKYNNNYIQQKLHQYIWMVANESDIPEGYDIHHIDGNKLNNSINNLELVKHNEHTLEHNKEKKKIFIGENNPFYGKKHTEETKRRISKANKGKRKDFLSKKVVQYTLTDELVKVWNSTTETSKQGYSQSAVVRCCQGKLRKHKGFKWKYIDNGEHNE